ncbi:hypothetical protein EVAR_31637_1 [Eumeta japonica]|uniref:Uncharacterized protein n=1 Tax=Eumeta variegata TaxID=151549 RepID=A0A4C1VZG1_EUMVA|nr:hypothetical protein EVAR_31637_1 [Eumeta japonica]
MERERESGSSELPLTGWIATAEAATLRPYFMRVRYITGRADPFLCCYEVGRSAALLQYDGWRLILGYPHPTGRQPRLAVNQRTSATADGRAFGSSSDLNSFSAFTGGGAAVACGDTSTSRVGRVRVPVLPYVTIFHRGPTDFQEKNLLYRRARDDSVLLSSVGAQSQTIYIIHAAFMVTKKTSGKNSLMSCDVSALNS